MYVHTEVSRYIPTMCWPQPFIFLSAGMLKYPTAFNSKLKIKRHFTNTFLMLVKPFTTALDPLKDATVHDQTRSCVH